MEARKFRWPRFWVRRSPSGAAPSVDPGQLADRSEPQAAPLKDFLSVGCLVLWGEPGIGKSTAIRDLRDELKTTYDPAADLVLWLDLRAMSTDAWLHRNLFDADPFKQWRSSGTLRLHVFLDSFDECAARVDNAAELIIDELKRLRDQEAPLERLYLRIACRTAVWPAAANGELNSIWKGQEFSAIELCPLRREDIVEASRQAGVDADKLLREISEKGVAALAAIPLTLIMVLKEFEKSGVLPGSQYELYRKGCERLCHEMNWNTARRRKLTPRQRMKVAGRIAAVMMFAGRHTVPIHVDEVELADSDVSVAALRGGHEQVPGERFRVDDTAIKETLDTGLFVFGGDGRVTFGHRSFAEFLAAWYMKRRRVSATQLMSLLVHPKDRTRDLIPQLYGVAAWLAQLNDEVLRSICRMNPWHLLESDIRLRTDRQRRLLVKCLLRYHERSKVLGMSWDRFSAYRRLGHDTLADTLRPYIVDEVKPPVSRQIAIEIAGVCEQQALRKDLLVVLENAAEQNRLRVLAAHSLLSIADDDTRQRFRPFVFGQGGADPNDELKGVALQAAWPTHLTAKELFAHLHRPKEPFFWGAYQHFLHEDLIARMRVEDLSEALEWIRAASRKTDDVALQELVKAILKRCWEEMDHPEVADLFARVALERIKAGDPLLKDDHEGAGAIASVERRRRLMMLMAERVEDPKELSHAFFARPRLLTGEDLSWLLDQLTKAAPPERQHLWAFLVDQTLIFFVGSLDASQVEEIIMASERSLFLKEQLAWLLREVEIGSPEARELKAKHDEEREWMRRQEGESWDPPLPLVIEDCLTACEGPKPGAWWILAHNLALNPRGKHFGVRHFEADITRLPGWQAADEHARRRIIEAAAAYLNAGDPQCDRWLDKGLVPESAFAGYQALRLLLSQELSRLAALSPDVWRRWAPVLVADSSSGSGDSAARAHLLGLAYPHARAEVTDTLLRVIERESLRGGHISVLHELSRCWDRHLGDALLAALRRETWSPQSAEYVLHRLLAHQVPEAEAYARGLLAPPLPDDDARRKIAAGAAEALFLYSQDAGWPLIWAAIRANREFGRAVMDRVAPGRLELAGAALQRISPEQLADWCIWIDTELGAQSGLHAAKQPSRGFLSGVSPLEMIGDFADSIVRHLEHIGAVEALEKIARQSRGRKLSYVLASARENARRLTWERPEPEHVLRLVRSRDAVLVRTGDELLSVIEESISRLQTEFQGETPASMFLWDASRPKDESAVSDYVKLHLQRDLKRRRLVLGREVEIRGASSGEGERSDIYVAAFQPATPSASSDRLVAIIEVKGCWNPKLDVAMQAQLADRYLAKNAYRNGLYLVAWFECQQWDPRDPRRRKHKHPQTIEETIRELDAEAARCSRDKGLRIRAKVLDLTLRSPSARKRAHRKKSAKPKMSSC